MLLYNSIYGKGYCGIFFFLNHEKSLSPLQCFYYHQQKARKDL